MQLKGKVLNLVPLCPHELTLPVLPEDLVAGLGSSMIIPQLAESVPCEPQAESDRF